MSTQHTPGSWEVDLEGPFVLGGDTVAVEAITPDGMVSREICTLMLDTDEHPDGAGWLEDAANARLIAAAPDLLLACQAAYGALGFPIDDESLHRVTNQLSSALAKVRGENVSTPA